MLRRALSARKLPAAIRTEFPAAPAAAAHPWMPVSSCETSCVEGDSARVSTPTVMMRFAGVVGLLLLFPLVNALTPRSRRDGVQRTFARCLLRCCAVRLRIVDKRGVGAPRSGYAQAGDGVLVVAGHVGWLDVPTLAAVQPLSFVARADLVSWPLLGGLARRMRVIPISRERLRELPGVVDEIGVRVALGERVAIFPEGTTWCGRAHGRLRPALFQASVDTRTQVQPVRLRYLDGAGRVTTRPGFVGDDTMVASIRRMLRSRRVIAEVVLLPTEEPGDDRRALTARCERALRT